MAGVRISQVRKSYGDTLVIPELSVDIQEGEFMVFVGPSGCGKSTLLRMVAGLEGFEKGEVHIDGVRVNDMHPSERDIAMVFQDYALYPHMTVRQNMGFGLRMRATPAADIQTRIHEVAEILQITHLLERRPRALSGGQRQRVAMGRAIVRKPKVFLFDEPLSNLDAKLRVDMRSEIKALHQRLKTTSIYVTHDQVEAMTMADRIVVMHQGRIEQIGPPLQLYQHPATSFVASFLGSPPMNMIDVTLAAGQVLLPNGISVPSKCNAIGRAVLGVRPEDLVLRQSEHASGLPALIETVEPLGAETLVRLELQGKRWMARVAATTHWLPGSTCRVSWGVEHQHVFCATSTKRLS